MSCKEVLIQFKMVTVTLWFLSYDSMSISDVENGPHEIFPVLSFGANIEKSAKLTKNGCICGVVMTNI